MKLMKLMFGALLILSLSTAWSGEPQEGHGHGGDPYALEFVGVGRVLAKYLKSLPADAIPEFTAEQFSNAVESTRVVTKPRVYVNQHEVDAKNFNKPRRLIMVGRIRWKHTDGDPEKRILLALHEYLGILDKDRNYEISVRFIELIKNNPELVTQVAGLKSCGLEGTLKDRTEQCEKVFGASPAGWALVQRINDSMVSYQDLKTGLIWSDYDPYFARLPYDTAAMECAFAGAPQTSLKGNLEELVEFRLPQAYEFEVAWADGLAQLPPHPYMLPVGTPAPQYWTSTVYNYMGSHYIFDTASGISVTPPPASPLNRPLYSLRCVGNLRKK